MQKILNKQIPSSTTMNKINITNYTNSKSIYKVANIKDQLSKIEDQKLMLNYIINDTDKVDDLLNINNRVSMIQKRLKMSVFNSKSFKGSEKMHHSTK